MTSSPHTGAVLLVSNLFSVGDSYGGVCKELAANLTKNEWQVTTASAVSNRLLRPLDMLSTIWNQRERYSVAQIDGFSGSAFRWAETSAWALERLKKPFVLTLHGGNLPSFAAQHPHRISRLINAGAIVTTPSRYLLEEMSTYRSDIRLIPNPIDIEPYPFRLRSSPTPRLLFLRALHRMYNPSLAVQTLQELSQTHPDAALTMVGPDKGDGAKADLLENISLMGLQDSVTISGAVTKADVPNIMSQADIFINTTNVDNTPISVIEAMACGLCIVSTNVGGIPYLLEHEHDALLVPPNDPQAMADAVRRILTEPGLAERLSRNARSKAEQFDWSVILPQWEALLLDVIEQHKHA